ncbi:hypothetical protein YQE_00452, partial [Dendroctonus ponderosae]
MARRRLHNLIFQEADEDFIVRRPRWMKEREDHFNNLDEKDFQIRFRLSKASTLHVLQLIEHKLEFPDNKNSCISPINQLICALRFYATGCMQIAAGDSTGCSTTTAHRIVHRVSAAIAALRPQFVKFPETAPEIWKIQVGFYSIARMPAVIGAIDCGHVKLSKSPGDNGELFRNRKGYFSLNVQAICNSNLEFTDIVARWPGSTHDSHLFNNCVRRAMFEQGKYKDAVLVGDARYACRNYLITPLQVCRSPAEHLYNESQIRTRNPIEQLFGVWKRRFPCMALGLRVDLNNSFAIIIATVVLHNIARQAKEDVPMDDPNVFLPTAWAVLLRRPRDNPNQRRRQALIENHLM